MAAQKRHEHSLTIAESRAMKFMAARLQENEARYQAFLATLDPRQRETLGFKTSTE